jgi:hypothetical protein
VAKVSPLQRSIKYLKEAGFKPVVKVEKWNAFAKIRQDLFGFIDLVALKDHTLGVQVTTMSHKQDHLDKITNHENYAPVKAAGWKIELHSWRKLKSGWTVDIEVL